MSERETRLRTRRSIEEAFDPSELGRARRACPLPSGSTTAQHLPRRSAAPKAPSDNGVRSPSRSRVTPKPPKVTRGPVGERVRRLAGAPDLRLIRLTKIGLGLSAGLEPVGSFEP